MSHRFQRSTFPRGHLSLGSRKLSHHIMELTFEDEWMSGLCIALGLCETFLGCLQCYFYSHLWFLGQSHSRSRCWVDDELTRFFCSFRMSVIDCTEETANLTWICFSRLYDRKVFMKILIRMRSYYKSKHILEGKIQFYLNHPIIFSSHETSGLTICPKYCFIFFLNWICKAVEHLDRKGSAYWTEI